MNQPTDADLIVSRNFRVNLIEGALYLCSTSFVSAQTLLPALLARLGGSNVEIGILGVFFYLGVYLPQIFSAHHVASLPWKKPFTVQWGFAQRFAILAIGVDVVLFGIRAPRTALWLFLLLYALNQIMVGITTPAWYDLYAKVTPGDRRGRLAGARTALGGAGALAAGAVLTWLLANFLFPIGYALALFGAFALQLSSVLIQTRLVETGPSIAPPRAPIGEFVRELPRILRSDPQFRNFLVASAFLIAAAMPIGFFTVYGLKQFRLAEDSVGEFTLLMVASQVLTALGIGYIGDRFGHKAALMSAGGGMLCANMLALLSPTIGWFRFVYPFLGAYLGTEMMARYNLSAEFAPPARRSTYVGLMNTILSPLYLLAIAGGALGDAWGFSSVFLLGTLFSVAGLALLAGTVVDPRAALSRP